MLLVILYLIYIGDMESVVREVILVIKIDKKKHAFSLAGFLEFLLLWYKCNDQNQLMMERDYFIV